MKILSRLLPVRGLGLAWLLVSAGVPRLLLAQPPASAVPSQTPIAAGRSVVPFAAYRVEEPAKGLRFLDAAGRALYFGHHAKGSSLVFAPAEAATADGALTQIIPAKETPVEIPESFWIEISKRDTARDGVIVRKGGYAVTDYIPVGWEMRAKRVKGQDGNRYTAPSLLWYDLGHNLIETNGASRYTSDAAYFRIYKQYSEDDCAITLVYTGKVSPPVPRASAGHPGEIVLPPDADLRERLAATELARHVKLITGKRIPVLCEPSSGQGPKIKIGAKLAAGLEDDLAFLKGSDGYAIRRKGDSVHVFGATSRGTLFGVFPLLEHNSDIIWFRPDRRYGTIFTPMAEMAFDKADLRARPAFARRSWSGPGGNDYRDVYLWQLRNGTGGSYYTRGGVFPASAYREKELGRYSRVGGNWLELPLAQHPERADFRAIIDGKRRTGGGGQPCFSAPGLMEATIAEARKRIAEGPEEIDFFDYMYSDSWACCECEKCMSPIPLPGGGELKAKSIVPQTDPWFRSTRTFLEASRLAAALDETSPGLPCYILSYIYTSAWPAITPHENIRVLFAAYDTSSMRFPLSEQTKPAYYAPESWAKRYSQWLEGFPKGMGAYEYFFTSIPAMFAEAAATNMQEMVKVGAVSYHSQTQPDNENRSLESFGENATMWDMNAMDQWLISRLTWDPFQSVAGLRSYFIRRVYGAAAPEMEEYYRLFGDAWFDRSNDTFVNCHSPVTVVFDRFIVRNGLEKPLRDLLVRAGAKATHPAARRHLARKLSVYDRIASRLDRFSVPADRELAGVWREGGSPLWNRAFAGTTFRRSLDFDYKTNLATNKTEVRLSHDGSNLYLRVTADGKATAAAGAGERYPMGDRVECLFKVSTWGRVLFVVGADGSTADLRDWDPSYDSGWEVKVEPFEDGWRAVAKIPLKEIFPEGEKVPSFQAVFLRTASDGEESYFRSDVNRNRANPFGSVHAFSRYDLSQGGN